MDKLEVSYHIKNHILVQVNVWLSLIFLLAYYKMVKFTCRIISNNLKLKIVMQYNIVRQYNIVHGEKDDNWTEICLPTIANEGNLCHEESPFACMPCFERAKGFNQLFIAIGLVPGLVTL